LTLRPSDRSDIKVGEIKSVEEDMARVRKRHVQQELFRHGGKRKGAGRPAKGKRPSERHKTRARLLGSQPVHVTLRVADDLGSFRRRDMFQAVRWATLAVAATQQDTFRIVHLSIQGNHIHLICEADDHIALARGLQGFEGSAAKHVNRTVSKRRGKRRKGSVFPDRYHSRILKSPTSVKRALSYVLNNWRHHGYDRATFARTWLVDPFSSGISFPGWKELAGHDVMWKPPPTYEGLWVWLPRTWLLQEGWRRVGEISARDVPAS
jgi:REP element-mobilizing transposase RayT